MDDQPVAVRQMNRVLNRFVLGNSPRHQKRTDRLKVRVGKSETGDKRWMVRVQQDQQSLDGSLKQPKLDLKIIDEASIVL